MARSFMTKPSLSTPERSRRSPAREVQQDIRQFERMIDETIAGGGALLASMLRVGAMAHIPTNDSQAAIERTVACLGAGVTMRAGVLAVHDDLRDIAGRINLREMGWGDLVDSPKTDARPSGGLTGLRVVD